MLVNVVILTLLTSPVALILPTTVSFSFGVMVPIPILPPSSKTISPPSVSTNLAIG